jgi:hypothetical protein
LGSEQEFVEQSGNTTFLRNGFCGLNSEVAYRQRVQNDWQSSVFIIKASTVIGWHRKGFRLFWAWKVRPGNWKVKFLAMGNPEWVGDKTVSLLEPTLDVHIGDRHKSALI